MKNTQKNTLKSCLSPTENSIIWVLLYFEIFKHPLKASEIHQFIGVDIKWKQLSEALNELTNRQILQRAGDYLLLNLGPAHISRRENGEQLFEIRMNTALKNAGIIARCPFVRGVYLSGTISKGVMYKNSDIDYFIVTAPNRVWVAKFFLLLYKKIFLGNNYHNFCINYFTDTDHLKIEEQNQFTATELVTLIPTYNYELYEKMIQANPGLWRHFPNIGLRDQSYIISTPREKWKTNWEWLLNKTLANWLNKWFMNLSLKKYYREFGQTLSKEQFELAFKSKSYVSKGHPEDYQRIVTEKLNLLKKDFEHKFQISL